MYCNVNWCIAIFLISHLACKNWVQAVNRHPSSGHSVCRARDNVFFLHHLLNPGGLITSPQLELKPGHAGLAFPSTILQLCHSGTTRSLGPCVLRRPLGCHSLFFMGFYRAKKELLLVDYAAHTQLWRSPPVEPAQSLC